MIKLPMSIPTCAYHRSHGDRHGCACKEIAEDICKPAYDVSPNLTLCPFFKRAYRKDEKRENRIGLPCIHLGNERRIEGKADAVLCAPCSMKQGKNISIKTMDCSIHTRCTTETKVDSVKCCKDCDNYSSVNPIEDTIKINLSGDTFNPSLIMWQSRLLLCYRKGWSGSTLWICELNQKTLQPIDNGVRLQINHELCRGGQEDPRLFVFRNRLHLQFSGVEVRNGKTFVHILFAKLTNDYRVEILWEPNYSERNIWEKNWGTFESQGELYSVYHPSLDGKHIVIHHVKENTYPFANEEWKAKWYGGELRGGASPILYNGLYWNFFHGFPNYSLGLYTFDSTPPFKPKTIIPYPLLKPDKRPGKPVIFPCGAVKRENDWLISFGRNDNHCEVVSLKHEYLEKMLK